MLRELWATARLAVPLGLAQLLMMAMGVVDVAFLGRFSAEELAGVAIGNAIAHTVQSFGMGVAFALEPLASQAVGAREEEGAWHWWRVIARTNLVLSVPMMAVVMVSAYVLPIFGVAQGLTARVVEYSWARLPAIPGFLYFLGARAYLQGKHHVRPVLWVVVFANIANFFGNALLIFGDRALEVAGLPAVGLPQLGGIGAGISTSLSTLLMALGLSFTLRPYARQNPQHRPVTRAELVKSLRIGLSIGVQIVAEIGIFALAAVLAGRLGTTSAGSHQVALTLAALSFMLTLGIGGAASTRVGLAVGRGDSAAVRRAGLAAVICGLIVMSLSAGTFYTIPDVLVRAMTDKSELFALAEQLLLIAAWFQLFDGVQAVMSGALRGAGDVKVPVLCNVVAHWFIGFPIALLCAFAWGYGAVGLWWGLTSGLVAVSIALVARFVWITRREIRRI